MRLGTTPDVVFTIPFDPNTITKLSIVFTQDSQILVEKTLADAALTSTTITVSLSEAETLRFDAYMPVFMQIRCGIGDSRLASQIMETTMEEILKGGAL